MKKSQKLLSLILIAVLLCSSISGTSLAATAKITLINNISKTVDINERYTLPATVTATMSDKTTKKVAVIWSPKSAVTSKAGTYTFAGTAKGYSKKISLTLKVLPAKAYTDPELARAVKLGIGNYAPNTTVTYKQFFLMLDKVVELADSKKSEEWKSRFPQARKSDQTMRRDEGMLALYFAAEALGLEYNDTNSDWMTLNEKIGGDAWNQFTFNYPLLPGWEEKAQLGTYTWDTHMVAAYFYSMGRSSKYSDKLIFDYDIKSNSMHPSELFTYEDALLAAVRLHDSGPDITETIPAPGDELEATFSNRFLEAWVRKQLKKNTNDIITIGDLNLIKEIKFVAGYDVTGKDAFYGYDVSQGFLGVSSSEYFGNTMSFYFYDLKDLAQFHRLKTLVIMGDQITDLSPLQSLPLEELNVAGCHVSDLTPLAKISTLKKLDVSGNPVSDLTPLAHLVNLNFLNVYHTNVTSIQFVKDLPLSDLNVGFNDIKDISIVNQMNLYVLSTIGCNLTDYSFLAKNKSLKIWRTSAISDKIAGYVAESGITTLNIEYNTSSEPLTDLNNTKLEALSLRSVKFNNFDFLKNCSGLTELTMYSISVPDTSGLKYLTGLQKLDAVSCKFNSISVLGSLKQLKNVTLPSYMKDSFNKIKNEVVWTPQFSSLSYYESRIPDRYTLSANPEPKPSDLIYAKPEYIPLSKVGNYDKSIITDQMLAAKSTLPEASCQHLPYWTGGYTIANASTASLFGPIYWREQEIKYIADQGMNCIRILYDFSYLSNPNSVNEVNLSELRRLDELISFGIKHGVHIEIAMIALPGMWNLPTNQKDIGKEGGTLYFSSESQQQIVKDYWTMLAARYYGISNKYLSFDLYAEPNTGGITIEKYVAVASDLAKAIWKAEGTKTSSEKRITLVETGSPMQAEQIVKEGCPIALHNSGVHKFAVGSSLVFYYENWPYLESNDRWPIYLQNVIWNKNTGNNVLTIQSDTAKGFPKGTVVSVYMMYDSSTTMGIYADGSNISNKTGLYQWIREQDNAYSATLNEAASKIEIKNEGNQDLRFYLIKITEPGQGPVYLSPHTFANTITVNEPCVTLTIASNGTVTSSKVIDADYYYNSQILPYVTLANEYKVGFMVGEIQVDSSVSASIAYAFEEMLIKNLYKNDIAWSDCRNLLFFNVRKGGQAVNYPGTPWYYDKKMWDVLKKYVKK